MKRIVLFAMAVLAFTASSVAQKYALVDMEYILKNIPSYEMANEQLNQVSQRWQKECDDKAAEAKTMYKNYQSDLVFLTEEMKVKREEEIVIRRRRSLNCAVSISALRASCSKSAKVL